MDESKYHDHVFQLVEEFNQQVKDHRYWKTTIAVSTNGPGDFILSYGAAEFIMSFQEGSTSKFSAGVPDRWHFTLKLDRAIKLPLDDVRTLMNILVDGSGYEYLDYRADTDPNVLAIWIWKIFHVIPLQWLDAICLHRVIDGMLAMRYCLYRAANGAPLYDHYGESFDFLQRHHFGMVDSGLRPD